MATVKNLKQVEFKLEEMGRLLKQKRILVEKRDERVLKIKQQYAEPLENIEKAIEACLDAICKSANGNRDKLLVKGKKVVYMNSGHLSWRMGRNRLEITDEVAAINYLIGISNRPELLKRKFSINQIELLRHPQLVEEMDGVEFVPASEYLYVKPHGYDGALKREV
jgi:phage host-nuclease inhibitor protein Gam